MKTPLIGNISVYQKIVNYMKDPDNGDLTESEQTLVNRWIEAWTLMRENDSMARTVKIMQFKYPNMSRAQCYQDCANAISMFGDISKASKEGIRNLCSEIVKDAIRMARIQNKPGIMIQGAKELAMINGVNEVDVEAPNFALLEPHIYNIMLDDNSMKVLSKILNTKGVINLDENVEDAVIVSE